MKRDCGFYDKFMGIQSEGVGQMITIAVQDGEISPFVKILTALEELFKKGIDHQCISWSNFVESESGIKEKKDNRDVWTDLNTRQHSFKGIPLFYHIKYLLRN